MTTTESLDINPFAYFTSADFANLRFGSLRDMLSLPLFRHYIAKQRWEIFKQKSMQLRFSEKQDEGVWPNTIAYNLKGVENSLASLPSLERSEVVFRPVMSIDRIYAYQRQAVFPSLRILMIGCRTEYEILMALGYGFDPANIAALDLISYSPWIIPGDMHNLPFPENSFDVIIMGWVLSYSKEPARVAAEVKRVARPDCVVSIGVDSHPVEATQKVNFYNDRPRSTEALLSYFGDSVGRVYFRNEPNYPMMQYPIIDNPTFEGHIVTTFDIKK